jgi:DUF4097 and DUF4098 domain-containing protein YvlB
MPHVRNTHPFSAVAALVLAAAALSACDIVVNTMEGGRAKAEQAWAKTYTLSGSGASIEIVNVNGTIAVETTDGNTLDVSARLVAHGATEEAAREFLKQVEIGEEVTAGGVRLQAKWPRDQRRRGVEITYTIKAPRSAKFALETVNGSVKVNGAVAGLKAETTNGSVEGRDLTGSVEATTTNGSVRIQMASLGAGGLSLETTNGSIDLKLPGDAKATVSARCVNGAISLVDLPFEKTSEASRKKLEGRVNGGGPSITAETVNGGVRIGRVVP